MRVSELLVPSDRTTVDSIFYNKRFSAIASAINSIGVRMDAYDTTVQSLIALGLDRIDQTLGPLLEALEEAQSLGFVVTEGASTFAPTPYLLAVDDNDYSNWGILSMLESGGQWTKETGDLAT